jgi:hypothetical protein
VATLIDASPHICSALSASILGGLLRGFMNVSARCRIALSNLILM